MKPISSGLSRSVIAKIIGCSRRYWLLRGFTVGRRLLGKLAATRCDNRPGIRKRSVLSRTRRCAGQVLGGIAVLMLTRAEADSLANWSPIESSTNTALGCVVYDGSAFIAAGADDTGGGLILRSDDGASWSRLSSPVTNGWLAALTYAQGTYVIVGSQGTILRSTNGTTWTLVRMAEDEDLHAVTYGQGLFLAGGQDSYGGLILTSPDGATWSRQPPGSYYSVTSLGYGDGAFLAGTYYGLLWRSVDGTNWAQVGPSGNGLLGGITFGADLAVAVGGWNGGMFSPGAATILTSRDGVDWQAMIDSTSAVLTAVAYGKGFYVAVGSDGAIHSSEDGTCWFPRFTSSSGGLNGIAFGSGVFVAVGENGTILRSAPIDPDAVRFKFSSCQPYRVGEPDGQITIPVRRVGNTNGSVSVGYKTGDGSALAGQDYEATAGTLTFAPGETEQKITVRIRDDAIPEGTETFTVQLQDPSNGAELSKPDSATIQILDDDSSHLDHWYTSYPLTFASYLHGVAYNGVAFVAVGATASINPSLPWNMMILRSTDGRSWEDASPGMAGNPRAFCWGGGNFVAVGFRYDPTTEQCWQQILSSPDGIAWRETPMAIVGDLEGIAYGKGRFVAVGSEYQVGQWLGEIMTSVDGLQWTKVQGLGNLGPLGSVAWGDGIFLAVGSSSNGAGSWTNYFLSSSDGTNWTPMPSGSTHWASGIAYGSGLFVLGDTDFSTLSNLTIGTIYTSPDGNTWTPQFTRTNLSLDVAAYVNGSFLVTGSDLSNGVDKSVLLTSSDGSSWNFHDSFPSNGGMIGMAYGDGLYVLAGAGIWTSPDTITWQERVPASVDLLDITHGGDLFVAVGSKIFTSPNGNQWTMRVNDPSAPLGRVVYGGGLFVAFATDGTSMTSRDGMEWTSRSLGTNVFLARAAFGKGQFVAIGGPGGNWVFVSTNGLDWKQTYAETTPSLLCQDLTFGNDLFVAVGYAGIFTSPDGVSWTSRPSGIHDQINAVTFGRGIFVAVGGSTHPDKWTYTTSVILTSPDGVTWTAQTLPWSFQGPYFYGWPLTGVVYGGDTFVAVGTGDQGDTYYGADAIVTSSDGVTWTARLSERGRLGLNRIATGNGRLVVVGQGGRTLRPGVVLNVTSRPTATNPALGLSVASEIGLHHEVQASTNLVDWNILATLTSTNFSTHLVDPNAGLYPRRFYRTRELTQ